MYIFFLYEEHMSEWLFNSLFPSIFPKIFYYWLFIYCYSQIKVYFFNIKSILSMLSLLQWKKNNKRVAWYLLILIIYVTWNMKQKLWYHTGIYFYLCQNWYNMAVKLQLLNQVSARARYLICMHDTREEEINVAEYNQYISNGKQQSK